MTELLASSHLIEFCSNQGKSVPFSTIPANCITDIMSNMNIRYDENKEIDKESLQELFLPMGWDSGNYPEKLQEAIRTSHRVVTAWDGSYLGKEVKHGYNQNSFGNGSSRP